MSRHFIIEITGYNGWNETRPCNACSDLQTQLYVFTIRTLVSHFTEGATASCWRHSPLPCAEIALKPRSINPAA